jgi:hypothetical protein
MAYYTGTVNTPAVLQSIIESQCVTNGWTLSSGWLTKGINHVKLTSPDASYLKIQGANSADGSTGLCSKTRAIWIRPSEWPVTYHLFIHTSPDFWCCVVHHNVTRIQVLFATDLVKIHSSAYVGGNLFWASGGENCGTPTSGQTLPAIETTGLCPTSISNIVTGNGHPFALNELCIPFTNNGGFTIGNSGNTSQLHAEIDGAVWHDTGLNSGVNKINFTDTTISAIWRSPNTWNDQTHLIPMNLQVAMADSLYGYLGYIEHMRLVRVDNYNIGDIITISPDEWKVFPWLAKGPESERNGYQVYNNMTAPGHTGTYGFAVRYN